MEVAVLHENLEYFAGFVGKKDVIGYDDGSATPGLENR
jgi:hypothetical protein